MQTLTYAYKTASKKQPSGKCEKAACEENWLPATKLKLVYIK
jgi:hypothetical protein